MPTPFAVSMTALSRDLSRCNLGHKTELFSQCHAKVQNLLQSANTFTTFNDKMMDILYMQYTIIGVKKELLRLSLRLAQEYLDCSSYR